MSIDYQKVLLSATNKNITEYSISEGTTEISPSAFINCNSLTNINMEESLFSNIGSEAFPTDCNINNENTLLSDSCSNTSFSGKVIIPNDVTSIGDYAFQNCTGLTSVTIPSSVTFIGHHTFYGCSNLTKIILENRTLEEAKSLIGTSNELGYTGTITYKDGGTYKTVYNNPYEQQ